MSTNRYTLIDQLKFEIPYNGEIKKFTAIAPDDIIRINYNINGENDRIAGNIQSIKCYFDVSTPDSATIFIKINGCDDFINRILYVRPDQILKISVVKTSNIFINPKTTICSINKQYDEVTILCNNEVNTFHYSFDEIKSNNGQGGTTGKDGYTPYIGANGNWWINNIDTDVSAQGKDGDRGLDGKSAYDIAVINGFVGTEEEWIDSLKGEDGIPGIDGADGKSAYEVAVETGFTGDKLDWLDSLKGRDGLNGTDGKDIDSSNHYTKEETDILLNAKIPLIEDPVEGNIAVIGPDGIVISGSKAIDDLTSNASNIVVDSSTFTKNLTENEDTLQKVLDRVDKFSFTDVQISNWIPGESYVAGDIRIYRNTFVRAKINTSNNVFDPTTEWETISGIMQYEAINKLPTPGNIGVLYVVVNDSSNDGNPKCYIWSVDIGDYVAVSSGGTSTAPVTNRVMVSPTDKSEGYLETKVLGDEYILTQTISDEDGNETVQLSIADTVFTTDTKTLDDIEEGDTNKYYVKNEALDSVGEMLKDTSTVDMSYDSDKKTVEAKVLPNTTVQKVEVAKNATVRGSRKRLDFVEGVGIKIDVADDPLNDAIGVTIKSEAEINTASNIGLEGIGIFNKKDVYDLQFKKIASANGKLIVEDDTVNSTVKLTIDESKLSINASQIDGLTEAISSDSSMTDLIRDSHIHTNSTVLSRLEDVDGHLSYNGSYVGDMVMEAFDADGDGIVDVAVTLNNLLVDVGTLNLLQGASGNIQAQINALSKGLHYEGSVDTYAHLVATEDPTDGAFIIVLMDETHSNGRSQYIYSGSTDTWEYNGTFDSTSRDFTINPINLNSEVFGILSDNKIDAKIARKTDIPQFANKTLLGNLSDVDGVLNYLGLPIYDKSMILDDTSIVTSRTWSSFKIYQEIGRVGTKFVNETNRGNNRFLVYDQMTDRLKYTRTFIPDWEQLVDYEKGNIVWANNAARRCKVTHTSGILFDNDVDNWDSLGSGGGAGGTATLKEISGTVTVAAGDSVFAHLSTGYNKYDIRSVYATSMIAEDIVIEIYNQINGGFVLYQSLENPVIQDIVNAPCEDKDYTKCIHIKFFNKGSLPADINYMIYVTSLS